MKAFFMLCAAIALCGFGAATCGAGISYVHHDIGFAVVFAVIGALLLFMGYEAASKVEAYE